MDESYLDNLLNEISLDKEIDHKIEEELDDQIQHEKRKRRTEQEISNDNFLDLDLEQEMLNVSDSLDLHFSEEQIRELDELDHIADLDIADLDFSDIDFDDLDVTKLDDIINDDAFEDVLKEFEGDLEVDDFFDDGDNVKTSMESDLSDWDVDEKNRVEQDDIKEMSPDETATDRQMEEQDEIAAMLDAIDSGNEAQANQEDLNEDRFDANEFLDSLLKESESEEVALETMEELPEQGVSLDEVEEKDSDVDSSEAMDSLEDMLNALEDIEQSDNTSATDMEEHSDEAENTNADESEEIPDLDDLLSLDELSDGASNENNKETETTDEQNVEALSSEEADDLDDLLSMLDLESDEPVEEVKAENEQESDLEKADDEITASTEQSGNDTSQEEHSTKSKKKSFLQLLFGDDDEDDEISQEELEAIEAKKAAKKAEKARKKEEAKAAKKEKAEENKSKKALADDQKKKAAEQKNKVKAEKRAKKKAEAEAEAKAEPQKKLNKPMVLFVFSVFLGGLFLFIVMTNNFNYTQAIEKATRYFANQKYRHAYDEIVGIEVKEKDENLKERIYTVMYVERLYESYCNNITMGYEEKALDSLLRGVTKYYEHYDEAEELGIVSDLDYSFTQIIKVLQERYGITVENAKSINAMENLDYVKSIQSYVEKVENMELSPKQELDDSNEEQSKEKSDEDS